MLHIIAGRQNSQKAHFKIVFAEMGITFKTSLFDRHDNSSSPLPRCCKTHRFMGFSPVSLSKATSFFASARFYRHFCRGSKRFFPPIKDDRRP